MATPETTVLTYPQGKPRVSMPLRESLATLVAIAAIVLGYWLSVATFPTVWINDRVHGYLVAGLCLWLVWRDRNALNERGSPQRWAVPVLAGVSLVWMIAILMALQVVHLGLFPLVLLLWLFVVRGREAGARGFQIFCAFSLAVPAWEVLVVPLRTMTVVVNTVLVFLTRIPAKVEGSLIHLQAGTLHVANSCAGLNYFTSGLVLGTGYAFLFVNSWRTRLKIVLAAGAVAILSNWLRVFGLVVVGHFTDMKSSLMQDHVVYGWLVFAASLPLFFHWANRIEKRDAQEESHSKPVNPPINGDHVSRPIVAATTAALFGPTLLFALSLGQPEARLRSQPTGISPSAAFRSMELREATWNAGFSDAQRHEVVAAVIDSIEVQLDRFLYRNGYDAAEMAGGSNKIAPDSLVVGEGTLGPLDQQMRLVREALVRTPDGRGRIVWYWYVVSGVDTPSQAKAKFLQLWAFLVREQSSEIAVVSAPCAQSNCATARRALFRVATGRAMPTASN